MTLSSPLPTRPVAQARTYFRTAAVLSVLAAGLVACGPNDTPAPESGGSVADSALTSGGTPTGQPSNEPALNQPLPETEGATSKGVLEVVNPETPDRPFYKEFGSLAFGTDVSWTTRLKNTGSEPVVIRSAQAACGCTRFMDYLITDAAGNTPARPTSFGFSEGRSIASVPPGASIAVRMQLMTSYAKPNQRKLALMRLATDSQLLPYITFEVGFDPTRSFVFAPDTANLTNSPVSSGKTVRIKILVDRAGDPERVLDVLSTPDGIDAELVTETFGGEYIWYLNVSVPPLSSLGPIRGKVVLRTTDEEGNGDDGRLELPVVALVVPDVVPSPSLVSFRSFESGAGAEFTGRLAALVPGARLKIESARFEGEHADKLSVEYAPIKPFDDGRALEWTYTVKLQPGHPEGYVASKLIFKLDENVGGLPEGQEPNELHISVSGVARSSAAARAPASAASGGAKN